MNGRSGRLKRAGRHDRSRARGYMRVGRARAVVRCLSVLMPAWLLVTMLSTLALATGGAPPAGAESLPPYPGISYPGGAFNSRCAQMSLSAGPNIFHVGQEVHASAGPATATCGGTADKVTWSWQVQVLGKVVSGCGANAASCVVRAEFPTSGWEQVCIDGGSPFGAWSSCGLVVVIDHGYVVSGTVTMAGSGQPAAGITVHAKCASGGEDTTATTGYYNFILDRGPCTIAPEPPAGETSAPDQRRVDVNGKDIAGVDFHLSGILYFKVEKGLAVTTRSPGGHELVKAGTSFTEQVTLKDLSDDKTVVVAPIYPALTGNADGGSLQPVGGVVQKQLSSMSASAPSPIVVLHPGEEQVFDSVIETVASRQLGTDGGQPVSGGTRATVQFGVPRAFELAEGDELKPVPPSSIEVADGSTDKIDVSIDDSAPDQTPYNGYLATYDISKGVVQGIYHLTYGLVHGLFYDLPVTVAKGAMNVPTALISYLDLESQMWQEAKDDPAEMALLDNAVTNNLLLIYKQAPFLLKKLGDVKASVDAEVSDHFNRLFHDWYEGDWESAVTTWTDDSTNFVGNAALLWVSPAKVVGALSDATIARVPGLISVVEAADEARYAAGVKSVDAALGTGKSLDEVGEAEQALYKSYPGMELNLTQIAEMFGVSASMLSDLAQFCRENHIVVTLRSRAFDSIDLIERGLAYVKPAAIKLKTVSGIDLKWLGFPADIEVQGQVVSSAGQVMFRDPIYLTADCAYGCAIAELQNAMRAQGLTPGDPEWVQVQTRWEQRYDEWASPDSGYVRQLEAAAKKGELTLDWHWQENHIDPSITAPSQTVGFRLSSGPDGVNIPEVCTGWSSATKICSGTWRSITGDIDLVSVTAADGTPLSDRRYVNVLQKLSGTEVQNQHGATATWYWQLDDGSWIFDANDTQGFPLKAVNLKAGQCCLLQVGADGVPREVILNLQGSAFNTKNDYFLNYIGRELVPAP